MAEEENKQLKNSSMWASFAASHGLGGPEANPGVKERLAMLKTCQGNPDRARRALADEKRKEGRG